MPAEWEPQDPDLDQALNSVQGLANLHFVSEAITLARQILNQRRNLSPNIKVYLIVMVASCLREQGDIPAARRELSKIDVRSISNQEVDLEVRFAYMTEEAALALEDGDREKALRLATEMARLMPNASRAWANLASVRYAVGDLHGAIDAMQGAFNIASPMEYFSTLIPWLLEAEEYQWASNVATLAVDRHPTSGEAHALKAIAWISFLCAGTLPRSPQTYITQIVSDADKARKLGISPEVNAVLERELAVLWRSLGQ